MLQKIVLSAIVVLAGLLTVGLTALIVPSWVNFFIGAVLGWFCADIIGKIWRRR